MRTISKLDDQECLPCMLQACWPSFDNLSTLFNVAGIQVKDEPMTEHVQGGRTASKQAESVKPAKVVRA